LHYTWFLVFFAVTWILAESVYPDQYPQWTKAEAWGSAVATSVLFFASVVAHELGHSLVAMANGIKVKSITLFVFGGVAQISREAGPSSAFTC
jgi:Zn-dependent protease